MFVSLEGEGVRVRLSARAIHEDISAEDDEDFPGDGSDLESGSVSDTISEPFQKIRYSRSEGINFILTLY